MRRRINLELRHGDQLQVRVRRSRVWPYSWTVKVRRVERAKR